jgi:hypothetical protein
MTPDDFDVIYARKSLTARDRVRSLEPAEVQAEGAEINL